MLNVRFLVNVTEAEHHDASVSKETETLAMSSRVVLRTLRNTVDFGLVQRILYIKVSPYKGEGKKSMIGTKWFVDDEVSNDMSSQCEFGVPVRHANETQVGGGNGVPMQSDKVTEKEKGMFKKKFHVVGLALASASRRTKECEEGMLGSAMRRLESRPEAMK
ncbi:hypothetical protein NDU88_001071 [Pleurodeles waltl]|uniref:Uncharacterized protein n=1 Tax=Pleurodeles waltl TaxID=8319 RepID=A0AAV7U5U8_PLEWA|nr:hypothetical protein NDU88_001071 [Pleurodeles waltl]